MENTKKNFKAQSAMEYLMTYGWAILIIAIVLAALYVLGVFNGSAFVGTTCTATSGALCTSPIATPGNFIVTLGQVGTTDWGTTTFAFVPTGSVMPATLGLLSYPNNSVIGNVIGSVSTTGSASYTTASGAKSSSVSSVPEAKSMTSGFTTKVFFNTDQCLDTATGKLTTCSSIPTAVGSTTSGEIWAIYELPSSSTTYYAQELGKVTMKIS